MIKRQLKQQRKMKTKYKDDDTKYGYVARIFEHEYKLIQFKIDDNLHDSQLPSVIASIVNYWAVYYHMNTSGQAGIEIHSSRESYLFPILSYFCENGIHITNDEAKENLILMWHESEQRERLKKAREDFANGKGIKASDIRARLAEQACRHIIELDNYEVANLRSALEAMGYNTWSKEFHGERYVPTSPLCALNTGDWLGQIYNKLPDTGHRPNATPQELAKRANEWRETHPLSEEDLKQILRSTID